MAWGHRLWEMINGGVTNQGIKVSEFKHGRSRQQDRRAAFDAKIKELVATYGFNLKRSERRRIAWDSLRFRRPAA